MVASKKDYIVPLVTLIAFVFAVIINALGATGTLGGIPTGDVSALRDNRFVPASWAFSIWGLIYFFQALYIVYTLTPLARGNLLVTERVGFWLPANYVFNGLWMICWQYQAFWVSVAFMACILTTLIVIYNRIPIDYMRNRNRFGGRNKFEQTFRYWVFQATFSIYLGWIGVATIANVAAAASVPGYYPPVSTPERWSAAMQTIAALLAIAMLVRNHDFVFAGVIVWSLQAIAERQSAFPVVETAALVLCYVVLVCGVVAALDVTLAALRHTFFQKRRWPTLLATTNEQYAALSAWGNGDVSRKAAAGAAFGGAPHNSQVSAGHDDGLQSVDDERV